MNLLEKIYDSAADRLVPNDADSATITSDIVAAHGSRTPRQLFNIFINTMMWMLDMRRKALSIPTAGRLVLPTSFLTLQKTSVVMGRLWFLDQTQRPGGRTSGNREEHIHVCGQRPAAVHSLNLMVLSTLISVSFFNRVIVLCVT